MIDEKTLTFAVTSQVSTQHIDQMWPLICDQHEHDFARRAYREGYGLSTTVRHRKELSHCIDEETGETYEFYTITSVAEVKKLKVIPSEETV